VFGALEYRFLNAVCSQMIFIIYIFYLGVDFIVGLVNTKEMLKKAYDEGYAIGAFNVNNMEIIQGVTEACEEMRSPVILQVSVGARKYAKHTYLAKLVEAAVEETNIPIALHLDHGDSFELCKSCIDSGFTSVMIDGSSLSYDDNVEMTKKVVDYAHKYGVTVEGELGKLARGGDGANVFENSFIYTDFLQVQDFATKTGVDSLAIAIGTSHGAYKFKPGYSPSLRFDILEEIQKRLPGFPIVLHGASSVLSDLIEKINKYGGDLEDAIGIPENLLKKSSEMAVCKINIDSDLRLATTAAIKEHLALNPKHFDPRQYLSDARTVIKEVVKHKIKNVLGSFDKV
jgi:fructose-bisphosphate aldolase class II